MRMTDSEKLILLMLSEIHQELNIKNGLDSELIGSAIRDDNAWAIQFKYGGVLPFDPEYELPPVVSEVIDILDMWSFIERGYKNLTDKEKQAIAAALPLFGKNPQFNGFDGNNETEYMSAAGFLINDLKRFGEFSGRELNSHSPSISKHRTRLEAFKQIRGKLDGRDLNRSELEKILGSVA